MGILDKFSDTYEVLGKLGEGSGGIVYKAYHKRMKKEVVIKEMKGKSLSAAVDRQEADILKNLHHMYLPQVFDFLRDGDRVYTVMSYIPGKSFQQLLREHYPFTMGQLVRWGMQLCSALNYLHSQKPPIIHSDIKPANIMLTPQGNICLIDFNISFFLKEGNAVLGYTSGYTSPEQYIVVLDGGSGSRVGRYAAIDERTDIYSVGATFYHLATGKKVKDYREPIDKAYLAECTSQAFSEIIQKAMETEPDKRFQSALEMFRAFQGLSRKDARYRALVRRQHLIRGVLVAAMAGFILLGGYGVHTIRQERVDRYNQLVEEQKDYREAGDYDQAEKTHEEAVKVLPSSLESYYQSALALYEQQEYQACIDFVDYDVEQNEKLDTRRERMGDLYYLEAESHFALEDYEEAVRTFEKLFRTGGYQAEYYRDYAIALAFDGQTEKGQEVLDEAVELGLTEDSVYYARGEIKKARQEYDGAIQDFRACISRTDSDSLKERAYLQLSDIYETQGYDQSQREVLLEARQALPVEHQMALIQKLIQVDIDLADRTGDSASRQEAVSLLEEVIAQGWDTYDTYNNLAVLNEQLGNLDQAAGYLDQMLEKYGEDYNIYMRYAFLEIDRQELLPNRERDYGTFASYYEKASQMYYAQLEGNDTDPQMQLLENAYQQVLAGGWLS